MSAQQPSKADALDLDAVRREIEAEARRLRESGELGGLERELDLVFARFAPVDAVQGDFESVMVRVDELTEIDLNPPLDTTNPVVAFAKRLIRKTIRWYVRWLASQTSGLGHALGRAVRLLSVRVEVLEAAIPPPAGPVAGRSRLAEDDRSSAWAPFVLQAMAGAPGRVMVGECGDGALLTGLAAGGLDAYGVEPVEALAQAADESGLEVRHEGVLEHLNRVPDAALGGIVLTGLTDRQRPGSIVALVDTLAAKLATGGVVTILGTHPSVWERRQSPVAVDLAPGRPVHAETWARLLTGARFSEVATATDDDPSEDRLVEVSGGDEMAVLNRNISRLNELLFPPERYAVTARRA